jgi:hypothetical protein
MKTIDLQTSGDIHLRLMKNQCPRCEGPLKVTSKTENRLERLCDRCNLTILDHMPGAECPDEHDIIIRTVDGMRLSVAYPIQKSAYNGCEHQNGGVLRS